MPEHSDLTHEQLLDFVRHLLRVARRVQADLDEPLQAQLDLSARDLLVLSAIAGGMTSPTAIAAHHHLPAPTVTRIISQLTDRGLVRRAADPADLRRFRLELTEEGLLQRPHQREVAAGVLVSLLGHLPPDLVRQGTGALRDLEQALNEREAPREAPRA